MTQTENTVYIALVKAPRVAYVNDDEIDDKKLGKSTSKIPEKAVIDSFVYPKHPNLKTKELGEKFWKDLSTGQCDFYYEKPIKNGKMFNDIKNYIEKYGAIGEPVVMFISGKYADWLPALPTFSNVMIILAGGGYNPKELTDEEMTEISTKDGSQPRFYIDHSHQVNLDVEKYNRNLPKGSAKLPVFRAITPEILEKYGTDGWEMLRRIPALIDTLMDFVYVDNFSEDELKKVGSVEKFTDKVRKLPGYDEKKDMVENARVMVDLIYNTLPKCTREDIQNKTPAGLRFQGAFCLARTCTRKALDMIWPGQDWFSKFFSLRSGLAEVLLDCKPNMVWGDNAIGVSLSHKYQSMFVPFQRNFKRNPQGYVSALPCEGNPVGNFHTLVFRPDLPIEERANLYEQISMDWWVGLMESW